MPRYRTYLAIALAVPLGLVTKHYPGPGHEWFNDYGAAIIYEIFWCLVASLFVRSPKRSALAIAIWVFVVTCTLETLQLSNAPVLRFIRSFRLGQYLIGTTFVWWDFPHYVLGCALGWAGVRALARTR